MVAALLAARTPNEHALELAPGAGYIMLFLAVCAVTIFLVNREVWRRLWLRAEDPRSMAVFRIVFGICAMCNINGLWELFTFLFTDEGIFVTDVARQVFAREQFEGFGNGLDGDPYGFFDAGAVWQFLKGPKYSLLFFWDSPRAFWIHWAAFQISITCMILGFKTRYTKWAAWFLFHSIILRNSIFWEGTENIYRTFFFYLCLSRCGHAYSIDNWLRCRKLRKQGRLSEPGGPGNGAGAPASDEHPHGLEAIYRRIPAWPRLLIILQCGALYCYTGVVKNGGVWWRGDAFYYALNLDHFYRFPPQQLSAALGTTMFRINAHVTHAWESLFPVVIVGLLIRFRLRERLPALSRAARAIHAVAWVGFGLGALGLCEYLYPVHFKQPRHSWWNVEKLQIAFAIAWIIGMVLIAWMWRRLRYRPFKVRGRTLDLDWFCRWFMGRRVWVFLGIVFHLHVVVMMNIGWFQFGALSGFIVFLNGLEMAVFLRLLVPKKWRGKRPLIPAEDPTLGRHRDSSKLPLAVLVGAAGIAVAGVFLQIHDVLHFGWTLTGIAAFLLGATLVTRRSTRDHDKLQVVRDPYRKSLDEPLKRDQLTAPWAYGPLGRLIVNCLVIYQVVGVACWLLPDKDSFTWRKQTHESFRWWLRTTQTTQGWRMFAPNPPRSNLFLRVVVTDQEDVTWDMKTDIYEPANRPIPWIWYTRQRKINRRIAGSEGGKGSWYQKWHARWYCRKWTLDHDGELPKQVELVKITYRIPSPEEVAKKGPYDPVERLEKMGKQTSAYTATCRTEVGAQPANILRERHGLAPAEHKIRRWNSLRNKLKGWENKKKRKAEARKRDKK